ncbi:dolichyl-phosphate-mannose-protein mannosyltransferase [Pelistega indica]|uniref:Dolichyl-phosphate-mannose-protein mannosyltransferase n=1 Tax=Pelistega indica TaxID=1414851 RepID=V8G9F8_9BURK|nr:MULTISPECIES: glycosyltransferase family 39 protein [Pelistega]ETD72746.1 dolichyl-phosphate-mannose-protein mannosyltransferase [Pelistega indica]
MNNFKFKQLDLMTIVVMLIGWIPMVLLPFQDTTEPRYAEISRLMASTNDWITPWFEPGVPFWGKPPLSFWAQALSIKMFGTAEWAVRLPSWLVTCLGLVVLRLALHRVYNEKVSQWAVFILSSFALVYLNSGGVLTDPFLTFGTTLCFGSFIVCMSSDVPSKKWGYLFFIGLSIGLLSKGPLVIVLVGIPIAIYLGLNWSTFTVFKQSFPWKKGFVLMLVLVLPWYIMAEIKTPGFLNYFIVGEHILRYIDPGWTGDLYGTAHKEFYGKIWLHWLVSSLPWWPVLVVLLVKFKKNHVLEQKLATIKKKPLFSFVLAWSLWCGVFFTFSGNILWTYLLPSMVGFALIVAWFVDAQSEGNNPQMVISLTWLQRVGFLVPVFVVLFSCVAIVYPSMLRTEKGIVQYTEENSPQLPFMYFRKVPFSATYYSKRTVKSMDDEQMSDYFKNPTLSNQAAYIAVNKGSIDEFKQFSVGNLQEVYRSKHFILFKVN